MSMWYNNNDRVEDALFMSDGLDCVLSQLMTTMAADSKGDVAS